MAGETKRALRRTWFQVHKWIGLILMIVLIPLSLSGSALVWHDALDRVLNPQRYAVTGATLLPPSAYVAAAAQALPRGSRIATLRYPEGDGPVTVMATPAKAGPRRGGPPVRLTVWLDPPAARVLDIASSDRGPVRFIHVLHGSLQLPGVGRAIVGWLGVAMAISCLSGVWLWWPAGRFVRALRWRRGDRRLDTNLHHMIGFWIVLPLAMLSVTGVWIAVPQMLGGAGMRRPPAPAAVVAHLAPDAALAAAQASRPGRVTAIAWPTADAPWRVTMAGRGRPIDVAVDDASGAAGPAPLAAGPPQGGLARTVRRWHDGEGMGPVWQVAIFLAGLAPTILGITASTMWLRSRRWRRSPARRAERALIDA